MTNNEFRERLIKGLQDRMPDAVIVPQDTKKNNGVVFSSIIIQDNSSKAIWRHVSVRKICIMTIRMDIQTWMV